MNAKLNRARSRPVDEWEEFRPAAFSPRPSHSVAGKLLIAGFLLAILGLIWVLSKPPISGTVAQIRKAISGLGQPPASTSRRQSIARGRKRRVLPPESRPQQARESGAALRPFEVYLLDGDRYIRVDASDRSLLLNTKTGETTWTASDNMADSPR